MNLFLQLQKYTETCDLLVIHENNYNNEIYILSLR